MELFNIYELRYGEKAKLLHENIIAENKEEARKKAAFILNNKNILDIPINFPIFVVDKYEREIKYRKAKEYIKQYEKYFIK